MHGAHEVEPDERVFIRVVQAGSLKAAAEQLGTDPSTVSRSLARLEQRLGVRLLTRSTRRSTPTDAGARYVEGLRRLAEQQAALEADISGSAEVPRGRLRVTAPVDFGARFVVPALAKLADAAPGLEVEAVLGSGFVDLVEQGFDVAIRIGRLADSTLIARRLGVVPRVLVGAPGYFKRYGRPRTAAELAGHEFVLYLRGNAEATFELRAPDGATVAATLRGRITVNSIRATVALVEEGRGLSLAPLWAFEESLAAGRVEAVLADHGLPAYPMHAVYAATSYVPAKIRAFVDAMAAQVRAEPTLQAPAGPAPTEPPVARRRS